MKEKIEGRVEAKTHEIRSALSQIAKRLQGGDNSELLFWVLAGQLACGQRPLRHHPLYGGSGKNIVAEAAPLVREWAEEMQLIGIRSIISLMHDRDLGYYKSLDLGASDLIEFYRSQGFAVAHLPWEDPHHKKTPDRIVRKKLESIRKSALEAFQELPKPVLVQCSAGIDRTAPVAAYIFVSVSPMKN